jgi:hypothetical protein
MYLGGRTGERWTSSCIGRINLTPAGLFPENTGHLRKKQIRDENSHFESEVKRRLRLCGMTD